MRFSIFCESIRENEDHSRDGVEFLDWVGCISIVIYKNGKEKARVTITKDEMAEFLEHNHLIMNED